MGIIQFLYVSRYHFNYYPFVRWILVIIAFEIFKWRGFGAFFPSGGKIKNRISFIFSYFRKLCRSFNINFSKI